MNQYIKKAFEVLNSALKNGKISSKRYYHSLCVAQMASKLCVQNSMENDTDLPDDLAELAFCGGLIHDILKDFPADELLQIAKKYGIIMNIEERSTPALLHSIVGCEYLHHQFDFPLCICLAVKYHTKAKPGMTNLEKLLFAADAISDDRTYPGKDSLRDLTFSNIDKGIAKILEFTIADLTKKSGFVCQCTLRAYDYYKTDHSHS